MRDKADARAKARLDADRAAERARIRIGLCDAKWDAAVAALGRAPRSTAVHALLSQDHAVGRAEIPH
jgi:hypothetical protein